MSYQSIDQLQKVLANDVFHHTTHPKKAAGRALGTLVEIITFYLLKSWGFENSITIEKALAEYGNPEITHNVEYSLHPILREQPFLFPKKLPLSSSHIWKTLEQSSFSLTHIRTSANTLLTSQKILRNGCLIGTKTIPPFSQLITTQLFESATEYGLTVVEQHPQPYAMFECKRVGIEEGAKKGPQTIEKAKQGAYVANAVSALQKLRVPSGELYGLIYKPNGQLYSKPYQELLTEIIHSHEPDLLQKFILTVGVVSNHGNWFTSNNHNKELKVLAQSYDWLLFLTDEGLAEFITELLLDPQPFLEPAKRAFLASYTADKKKNAFTKVQMEYNAHCALQGYFQENISRIENWFNVITPSHSSIKQLYADVFELRQKDWLTIHSL